MNEVPSYIGGILMGMGCNACNFTDIGSIIMRTILETGEKIPLLLQPYSPTRVIPDYTVPGLNFWFLSKNPDNGLDRYAFEATRHPSRWVTPHNHLGDLHFHVLRGRAWEVRYTEVKGVDKVLFYDSGNTERWIKSSITNTPHEVVRHGATKVCTYLAETQVHLKGSMFFIGHPEIHSIEYSKGTIVVFDAGPTMKNKVDILEPQGYNGIHIKTHTLEPWMFGGSQVINTKEIL